MIDRRNFLRLAAAGSGLLVLPAAAFAQTGLSVEEVLRDPRAPVLGNPDGDVTVIEYFDYQCPYCKRGYPAVVDAVQADGRTRLVMKDWPIFGAPSLRASRLVLAGVETGEYKAAHDALMDTPAMLSDSDVDETLQGAGLDPQRLIDAYRGQAEWIDALLQRNSKQAEAFRFLGTPSFVVETTLYPGVLGKDDLVEAINEARG